MRFIHVYLVGYFLLVMGAGLALWQAGILGRIGTVYIVSAVIIALGLGIMLAVTAGKPTISNE